LHYYQLDNTGIRKEEIIEHQEDPQAARKLFTGRVTSALISAVQGACDFARWPGLQRQAIEAVRERRAVRPRERRCS
jgi:predicted solute-binding protein